MTTPDVIFGTAHFGVYEGSNFDTKEKVQTALSILKANGSIRIDTARRYPPQNSGTSEQVLGQVGLSDFTVDTKVWSMPGHHKPIELQRGVRESLEALNLSKVNILYLHVPEPETPLEDVCRGINDIYTEGKFVQFGIGNFAVSQIKQMIEICDANGYVKPTVYQGRYNVLARNAEVELLPLLRKNGISFYAYAPAAGSAFNDSSTRMAADDHVGDLWRAQYGKAVESIVKISEPASQHGLTGHAAALGWVLHHSALRAEHGDAMIVGARTLDQLKDTLEACNTGLLSSQIVEFMDEAWEAVKDTAPL